MASDNLSIWESHARINLGLTKRAKDKAAIKAQIEAGEVVPGAILVRGGDTVSVRTK